MDAVFYRTRRKGGYDVDVKQLEVDWRARAGRVAVRARLECVRVAPVIAFPADIDGGRYWPPLELTIRYLG